MQEEPIDLLGARQGHFRMESGYHSDLWLELDPVFLRPRDLQPAVDELARRLAPIQPEAICGPLIGGAFLAQMIAQVLDVEFYYAERSAPAPGGGLYPYAYHLPHALREPVRGKAVAIVDDVISAGSAVRGALADLRDCGARPVAISALLIQGEAAAPFAASQGLPLISLAHHPGGVWAPDACPLCAAGVPLEEVGGAPTIP